MKIGLIDLDRKTQLKTFPNLALMKLSAWHKAQGDEVDWYNGTHCDKVYVSKVFNFSPEYDGEIDAAEIVRGGAGYAISSSCGVEVYDKEKDKPLPYEVEHIYPDYDLYGIKDTAYGYITRGCRNDCSFCHVPKMFCGKVFHRVANLSEFWHGQKNIVLLDPNIFACEDWKEIFQELIDSKANVDFSQGLDIRLLDDEKLEMLKMIKFKTIHFAWDNYEDGNFIMPKFEWLKEKTGWGKTKVIVYILCNYNSTHEQDYERCLYIRELRFQPYVMIYDKKNVKRGSEINKLARWCNWSPYCWGFDTYEEFKKVMYKS